MEREPGDPGIPYDPDRPDRLQPAAPPSPSDGWNPVPAHHSPHQGRRGRVVVGLLVLGAIVLASRSGGEGEATVSEGFSVADGVKRIRVDAGIQDVTLATGVVGEVATGGGGTTQETDGDILTLRVPSDGTRLELPPGLPVEIISTAGDVEAEDLDLGDLTVRTETGDVDLVYRVAPTDVTVQTSTGDVDVDVPEGEKYAVDAYTSRGETEVGPTVAGASRQITARTDTGDITVD